MTNFFFENFRFYQKSRNNKNVLEFIEEHAHIISQLFKIILKFFIFGIFKNKFS